MTNPTFYCRKFILDIFSYLEEKVIPEWDHDKLFIDGEYNGNHQTKFEKMSNNLEIGVLANSELAGCVILFFLRFIIDEAPKIDDAIGYHLDNMYEIDVNNLDKVTMLEICNSIKEEYYSPIYEPGGRIRRSIKWGRHISKDYKDIEVWNAAEIKREIILKLDSQIANN